MKASIISRILLIAFAVVCGIAADQNLQAQTVRPDAQAVASNAQTQPPGQAKKMRSMTNAERWAAAIRLADRRADYMRKKHGK